MRYGSVESMVCWLDRKETAAAKERRFRNAMRRLPPLTPRSGRGVRPRRGERLKPKGVDMGSDAVQEEPPSGGGEGTILDAPEKISLFFKVP